VLCLSWMCGAGCGDDAGGEPEVAGNAAPTDGVAGDSSARADGQLGADASTGAAGRAGQGAGQGAGTGATAGTGGTGAMDAGPDEMPAVSDPPDAAATPEAARDGSLLQGFTVGHEEGTPCQNALACERELECVDSGRFAFGFCARLCGADEDCMQAESCTSFTGAPQDAHCVHFESEEFALCGEVFTALCAGDLTCLLFTDSPLGVCVRVCSPGGNDPQLATCSDDQTCIGSVIEGDRGVCGSEVGRGEVCGIDQGLFCGAGDVCSRRDAEDTSETPRCRQDCTSQSCQSGSCAAMPDGLRVCVDA